jgi:predicted DNA-binding transcriptional regulator AlpA
MTATTATAPQICTDDEWVPDPRVRRELGISEMTLWRWTRDAALGFPKPIKIRERNFRSRRELDAFKARMLADALRQRA